MACTNPYYCPNPNTQQINPQTPSATDQLSGGYMQMNPAQMPQQMQMPQDQAQLFQGQMQMPQDQAQSFPGQMQMPQSQMQMPMTQMQMPMGQAPMGQMQMPMMQMPMGQMQMPMGQMQMPMTQIPSQYMSQPNYPPSTTGSAPVDYDLLPTVPVFDMGYTQGYLRSQIGRRVRVEFLLGTNTLQDREGTLVDVGISYIIINEVETDDLLLCDIYSIKFVRFYY